MYFPIYRAKMSREHDVETFMLFFIDLFVGSVQMHQCLRIPQFHSPITWYLQRFSSEKPKEYRFKLSILIQVSTKYIFKNLHTVHP